jgi:hypothetical protein
MKLQNAAPMGKDHAENKPKIYLSNPALVCV